MKALLSLASIRPSFSSRANSQQPNERANVQLVLTGRFTQYRGLNARIYDINYGPSSITYLLDARALSSLLGIRLEHARFQVVGIVSILSEF